MLLPRSCIRHPLHRAPHRNAYDNLKAALARILVGSERTLAARFLALATHYLLEACFARPRTGHDKGGVDARGKGIRWQELVPIPSGDSLDAISGERLARLDARQTERRPDSEYTIGALYEIERPLMLPLPAVPYRSAALHSVSVSRRGLVKLAPHSGVAAQHLEHAAPGVVRRHVRVVPVASGRHDAASKRSA